MNEKEVEEIITKLTSELSSSRVVSHKARFMIGNVGRVMVHSVFGESGLVGTASELKLQKAATIKHADMTDAIDLGNNSELWVPLSIAPGGPRKKPKGRCPNCGWSL